jgi:hypothetical protein
VILDCRIARCVNGIDMFLYEKALAIQRDCVRADAVGLAAVNEEIDIISGWFNAKPSDEDNKDANNINNNYDGDDDQNR